MPPRLPLIILLATTLCSAAALPDRGPVPVEKPETAQESQDAPVLKKKPSEKPAETPADKDKPGDATDKDANGDKTEEKAKETTTEKDEPVKAPEPVLTIEPESAVEHAACLADLKAIGATFHETDRIDDGKGCGIDKPLVLEAVLPGIKLAPEGTMRCETALELARWTREAVMPAAKAALEAEGPLTTINQASSYICRLRNNATTGKISEHARGNAVDIASFTFKSGKTIAIEPRDEDSTLNGAFQRAVTASGCLYFATVLDPGSDEAHEDHLHFDVMERKNGYRYCR